MKISLAAFLENLYMYIINSIIPSISYQAYFSDYNFLIKLQDCFQLYTPGGGGWGDPSEAMEHPPPAKKVCQFPERGSVATYQMLQESA